MLGNVSTAGECWTKILKFLAIIFWLFITSCCGWLPDMSSKLHLHLSNLSSISFFDNTSSVNHFIILNEERDSILVGGRNRIYNLSVYDLKERGAFGIWWPSSEAHKQLCILKGKNEDDCQNYIRVAYTSPGRLFICGTNSFKPVCRVYAVGADGRPKVERDMDGIGICPHDPEHNSTAIFSNGHLFSATVADFSGGDPLIYREPQRTELSDLKQLNAPNFVSSMSYGDFVFIFYRETAVEYMNCGKIIYSRVGRVCKNDKGGPHQSRDRWTSFLKTRLNCSVPGEYPFYFDEIQSTSDIIDGVYSNRSHEIVYSVLTTPSNAIGGSAVCLYDMKDILHSFEGSFKSQESINSNWLPVPESNVPEPRPGQCVSDSRLLPDKNVNFIKTHPLMETAVPALFGKPILIKVSYKYRIISIAVDPQVQTFNNEAFDVLYLGTDDGKVLKAVNIPSDNSMKAVVISESKVFQSGAVKQIKLGSSSGKVIAVTKNEVKLVDLNHCKTIYTCWECVELQDPHCAWDPKQSLCVSLDAVTLKHHLIQHIIGGNGDICFPNGKKNMSKLDNNRGTISKEFSNEINEIKLGESTDYVDNVDCNEIVAGQSENGCAVKKLMIYTAGTLHFIVIGVTILGLIIGFMGGYLFSKRFHASPNYPEVRLIEQHNHLERLNGGNHHNFLPPRLNKSVNLDVSNTNCHKKDNLNAEKDLNIVCDGTLQKIKKTYI